MGTEPQIVNHSHEHTILTFTIHFKLRDLKALCCNCRIAIRMIIRIKAKLDGEYFTSNEYENFSSFGIYF